MRTDAPQTGYGTKAATPRIVSERNGPIKTVERLTGPSPLTGISREQDEVNRTPRNIRIATKSVS